MTRDITSMCVSHWKELLQQWIAVKVFAWEILQYSLLSRNSGLFVELVAVTDNASFIPSSSVITRQRLGERNKYVEGRPCAIHTWSR